MLLQHLKVVFLICGVLVNHEDVRVELCDNEAQVELTNDLHLLEHVFAVEINVRLITFQGITLQYCYIQPGVVVV